MLEPTIAEALQFAAHALTHVGDSPALEAEVLLSHILSQPRAYLLAYPERQMLASEWTHFVQLVERREDGEPVAYLTGSRSFWSFELAVNRDTLIPRPETESVVQAVLDLFPMRDAPVRIADLGTGSGAIALALQTERPAWEVVATDVSAEALQVAKANAARLGLQAVHFYQGSWCQALPDHEGAFDVIVSNPPYIGTAEWPAYQQALAFEPIDALLSGTDGLEAIREIGVAAKHHLKSGGYLVIEHGFAQAASAREWLHSNGYQEIISIKDLLGHERVTVARWRSICQQQQKRL
jgi:release factor glutamine methyltransferase